MLCHAMMFMMYNSSCVAALVAKLLQVAALPSWLQYLIFSWPYVAHFTVNPVHDDLVLGELAVIKGVLHMGWFLMSHPSILH